MTQTEKEDVFEAGRLARASGRARHVCPHDSKDPAYLIWQGGYTYQHERLRRDAETRDAVRGAPHKPKIPAGSALLWAAGLVWVVWLAGCSLTRPAPEPCPDCPEPPVERYSITISQGDSTWHARVHDGDEVSLPEPPVRLQPFVVAVAGADTIEHLVRSDTLLAATPRVDTVQVPRDRSYDVTVALLGGERTATVRSDTLLRIANLGGSEWHRAYYKSTAQHQTQVDVRIDPFEVRQSWYRHAELVASHSLTTGVWTWPTGTGKRLPDQVWEELLVIWADLEK